MAINSCSSSASRNVATQYAEALAMKAQDRLRGTEAQSDQSNQSGTAPQAGGATVNGRGERVGTLVSTTA